MREEKRSQKIIHIKKEKKKMLWRETSLPLVSQHSTYEVEWNFNWSKGNDVSTILYFFYYKKRGLFYAFETTTTKTNNAINYNENKKKFRLLKWNECETFDNKRKKKYDDPTLGKKADMKTKNEKLLQERKRTGLACICCFIKWPTIAQNIN